MQAKEYLAIFKGKIDKELTLYFKKKINQAKKLDPLAVEAVKR